MKHHILQLSAFVIMSITLLSCDFIKEITNSQKPTSTVNYIFLDITATEAAENILTKEHIAQLVSSVGWNKGGNIYNGGVFRLFNLSDLTMTKSIDFELPVGNNEGMNAQPAKARQGVVNLFIKTKLEGELLQNVKDLEVGKERSEIFANLSRQLTKLAQTEADKKNVIIYSDLLENSDLFSFYKGDVSKEQLVNAEKTYKFPDLKGISIYVVPPITKSNNKMIDNASRVWEEFFAYKDADKFIFDVNLKLD